MNVTGVSLLNEAKLSEADAVQSKAAKAGAQFEAILLNTVFGDLQRTFSALPGKQENAIAESYDGLGMEALTSGLARDGGIGLGAVITKALMRQAKQGTSGI
jgi:Rod binding domain-containing protein